ncbi:MAG: hypothetical protein IIA67_07035 [Planctomycetes bacterium]|nr:hypothetical protein [Planctomycetota bacterium]
MFGWLKKRLVTWAEEHQRLEIARLKKKSQRLSEEIEQATGQPFRLTSEELRQLAEKAKGMEREQVRETAECRGGQLAETDSSDVTQNLGRPCFPKPPSSLPFTEVRVAVAGDGQAGRLEVLQ